MRQPVLVSVKVSAPTAAKRDPTAPQPSKPDIPQGLTNYYVIVPLAYKLTALLTVLRQFAKEKVIVYTLTCASVDWLYRALCLLLKEEETPIYALHGQMPMAKRRRAHQAVNSDSMTHGVVVCTDVAARGLDLPLISLVIQYDAPTEPETFIHRIGRTARMGRSGTSLVLLSPQEQDYVIFMKNENVDMSPFPEPLVVEGVEESQQTRGSASAALSSGLTAMMDARFRRIHRKGKKKKAIEEPAAKKGAVRGAMCNCPAVYALRLAAKDDADLRLLALRAFVSYVRAYREHACSYIFQLRSLNVVDLIHSFALLTVPNCSELRHMARITIPLQPELATIAAGLPQGSQRARRGREADETNEGAAVDGDESAAKKPKCERNARLAAIKEDADLGRNGKRRAWQEAELDELRRESYLIRKERMGRISSSKVDSVLGSDALENAHLSARERRQQRRVKQQQDDQPSEE
jgi:ATP-dependent RNA helicase DDX55/SPB4